MSTLAEIADALPSLTNEELLKIEALIHSVQRQRGTGVIVDDAYGTWTDDDQSSVVAEAWNLLDGKPGRK